ncbi:hypothetical protein [Paratissierella segnis]|jgi:hypothetical protein|uniref:Uncharacterized protein n=1 Tax=Paratissierella segnis TaxID=2763679 RepID=A0A926EU80_9FIRM|nr:hypothetical protein [Paratissierella segnis]MBC8587736.1 hypothetical protein [Paratissierella segnis]
MKHLRIITGKGITGVEALIWYVSHSISRHEDIPKSFGVFKKVHPKSKIKSYLALCVRIVYSKVNIVYNIITTIT